MKHIVELTIQHMTIARLLVAMRIKIGHVIIPDESSSAGLIVPSIALLHRPSTATSVQLGFAQIPVDGRTDGLNAAQQVFVEAEADADADADDGKRVKDYMQCSIRGAQHHGESLSRLSSGLIKYCNVTDKVKSQILGRS